MKCDTCFAVTDEATSCEALQGITKTYRNKCSFYKTPGQLQASENKARTRADNKGFEFKTNAEVMAGLRKQEEQHGRYKEVKKARKTAENSQN